MEIAAKVKTGEKQILGKATLNAAVKLGLTQKMLERIVGRDRSSIYRSGIDPKSKEGELSLLLIRCYRSLYALMGGDEQNIKHFMKTENTMTFGIPAQQILTIQGLVRLVGFLDAMRGKA
ncbi:MbcA/ParS/Xre antitoxin family protein [Facilibium subflavum]|uniref:MbcA/ParS/Xre antitoxin family protein n=1 Tax=Facilibium subflavum TaxID=2219058 RepID=UPI000E649B89|nr:MbcA/ParS/Xre antitoxin family protein [Facilibium subflavum]